MASPQFVGVSTSYSNLRFLKQQLILFDRIAAPGLKRFLNLNEIKSWHKDELDFLQEKNLLFHMPTPFEKPSPWNFTSYHSDMKIFENSDDPLQKLCFETIKKIEEGRRHDPKFSRSQFLLESNFFERLGYRFDKDVEKTKPTSKYPTLSGEITLSDYKLIILQTELAKRLISMILRNERGFDAIPCISHQLLLPPDYYSTDKTCVVHIILKEIPVISESTPWEDIFEFKENVDVKLTKDALRVWMSKVSREKYTKAEIEEELEFLINKYTTHMNFHKLKHRRGKQEILIKMPLGLTEDILKVRLEKMVDRFFEARLKESEFIASELNCPGQEVAYIVRVKEQFD